jgi:hypothetical protein
MSVPKKISITTILILSSGCAVFWYTQQLSVLAQIDKIQTESLKYDSDQDKKILEADTENSERIAKVETVLPIMSKDIDEIKKTQEENKKSLSRIEVKLDAVLAK